MSMFGCSTWAKFEGTARGLVSRIMPQESGPCRNSGEKRRKDSTGMRSVHMTSQPERVTHLRAEQVTSGLEAAAAIRECLAAAAGSAEAAGSTKEAETEAERDKNYMNNVLTELDWTLPLPLKTIEPRLETDIENCTEVSQ